MSTADAPEKPEEAITEEETKAIRPSKRKNACLSSFPRLHHPSLTRTVKVAELMAPKQKMSHHSSTSPFRLGLGAYITDPASYPSSQVIYHNDKFVAIHDLFPKATVHTLLLPRDEKTSLLHPFDALDDENFRKECVKEVQVLESLVAAELQRLWGKYSKKETRRQEILNGDAEPLETDDLDHDGLPRGRDWEKDIMVGVHAVPSMHNLHIHVLSRDMYSPCLKHRKHYNSFNTGFFVPLEAFPLGKDDPRRKTGEAGYLKEDFVCWRCSKGYGSRFKDLKGHLDEEFEEWKKE